MLTLRRMLTSLVTVLVLATFPSTEADEKSSSCCKTVSRTEIPGPITGYWVQQWNAPCIQAVILQTEKGLMCSDLKAPWVRRKIQEFRKSRLSTGSPRTGSPRTSTPPPTSPPSPSPSLLSLLYPSSASPSRTASAGFLSSSSTDSTMKASTTA